MIDFSLTEEQKILKDTAHRFALERIRPVAAEVDRNPNPDSFPMDLYIEASQLGFTKMLLPEKYGGPGMGLIDMVILLEELAWGDAGFANTLGATILCSWFISAAGNDDQKERFLRPFAEDETGKLLLSAPYTEPEGGSEVNSPLAGPDNGTRTVAVKDGSSWVLNGIKLWASSSGLAWLYLVVARTDPNAPNPQSNTVFLVPGDTPGMSFGSLEDKMGRRTQRNQEIFFENVRVPEENVLGPVGLATAEVYQPRPKYPGVGHLYLAASTVGLAQAAYEEALKFSGERVAWGKPIKEHQLIARKLVDMRFMIEAMRAFTWKVAWALEHKDRPELSDGLSYLGGESAKYYATEAVVGIVREAMQIFGAVGYTRDLPVEKWMRDAVALSICGTTNEVHSIILSKKL